MASLMNRSGHIASLILLGLLLAGCEGSDGAAGADGATGAAGPPGPPGPSSGNGVPIDSTDKINIAITNINVPAGGGAPTLLLTLTNDLTQGLVGLPAGDIRFTLSQLTPGSNGGSSEWQSYITRDSGGIPDAQANTERGTAGTFIDNNDGTYQYTFASDLTAYPAGPAYDETKTHRIGIEIRGQAPITSNGIIDFVPVGGAPTFERKIVDTSTCDACHDRLEFHGGPRTDVEYCVTCHNPHSIDGDTGNTVDMKALVHNIHSARADYQIIGFGGNLHEWSDLVWPQDIRNCATCHDESNANTPQASNWRLVPNRAACGTCHYDDGDDTNGEHDYAIEDGEHPLGLQFVDDTQCLLCHGPDSTVANGDVQVAKAHEIATDLASEAFQYNILSVTNTAVGANPVVQFSVTDPTNGDAPYDIQNDPEFTTCTFGLSRLAVSIAWDTTDYTNTGSGNTPAQPVSMNPLTACGGTSTDEGGGVFSVTSPTAVPAGTTGTLAATMDGHPAVDIDGVIERIAVTNAVFYEIVTDTTAQPRRNAVAIEKCDDCHNQLAVHGNNRTDNPEVCVVCHNPNATDINQRSNPPCSDTLGTDDVPIDFKRMIHQLHGFNKSGIAFDVCGFGNSVHTFDFVYPGHLDNCEGCHRPGGYYPFDPAEVLGTTVSVGADAASPVDDVVISPNASVCSSCHTSSLARSHMEQNGGDFAATKAADSALISSGVETCSLCHGAGRSADVGEVHGVADFQFN